MDEADVKSEQFGQERGAQALPKQFVVVFFVKEKTADLRPFACLSTKLRLCDGEVQKFRTRKICIWDDVRGNG